MARKKISGRPDADRRLRQSDRIARVLRVLQLIQGRGRWNTKEIAAELECSERTVYRDLQVLEMAGVQWFYDVTARGYRIRPGWQFPVLNLNQDELLGQVTATVIANSPGLKIGAGAGPTTRKLAATMNDSSKQILEDAERVVAVLDMKLADHSRSLEVIKVIQTALIDKKQVAGQYATPYQSKPIRLVLHPFRLCFAQQAWYLIAQPADRDRPKIYRVGRFKSLRLTDAAATVPEDFDLAGYFGNAWGIFRGQETHEVEVEFSKEAAPLACETNWHATQKAKHGSDGTVTLSFTVDGLEEIVGWVLGWSGRVKVIRPGKLRTMVVEELQRALELNKE